MSEPAILLTIKRRYAKKILDGSKPREYRKRAPRISKPTRTIMYVSTGSRELLGEFIIEPVCGGWVAGKGYPLPVRSPVPYKPPILWRSVRKEIPEIGPPQQNFRYLHPDNAADLRLLELIAQHRRGRR